MFLWAGPLVREVNPMGATEQSGHHLIILLTAHKLTKYKNFETLGCSYIPPNNLRAGEATY